jgi:hypothetical protein
LFVAKALSDIPVSHVAKTFSQLKEEGGNVSTRELKEETFSARELDKLTRLESHAILDEIGALQDTHVDTQVRWLKRMYLRNYIILGIQSYPKKYDPYICSFLNSANDN